MKVFLTHCLALTLALLTTSIVNAQEFQGKAYYFSKTPMNLGTWGARMSEEQKKEVGERLKNRLEKTYVLTFNKEESVYKEDEKLDAISGATDSWGSNFAPGPQYKNVKTNTFAQNQDFYGKQFLVKEDLQKLNWKIGTETKQIGNYTCFKATCIRTDFDVSWYDFSWDKLRKANAEKENSNLNTETTPEDMVNIEAWYTPMIPVNQGPGDYWGLPGLILEISVNNTTLLCFKIVMNPEEKTKIEAPSKGKLVTKEEYKSIINIKMQEMRDNRGGRRN